MATIKVIGDYEIDIDSHCNHEARQFKKFYKDKDGNDVPNYRTIGHYKNVPGALSGIYKDMCIQKANKKDSITVSEWIDILKETETEINNAFDVAAYKM